MICVVVVFIVVEGLVVGAIKVVTGRDLGGNEVDVKKVVTGLEVANVEVTLVVAGIDEVVTGLVDRVDAGNELKEVVDTATDVTVTESDISRMVDVDTETIFFIKILPLSLLTLNDR
jgi:hypothetical protein